MASRSRVSRGVPVAGSNVSNRASESETCRVCAEVTAMSLAFLRVLSGPRLRGLRAPAPVHLVSSGSARSLMAILPPVPHLFPACRLCSRVVPGNRELRKTFEMQRCARNWRGIARAVSRAVWTHPPVRSESSVFRVRDWAIFGVFGSLVLAGNWFPELNLSSLFPPVPALFPEQGSDLPPVPHPLRGEQVGTRILDGLVLNLCSRSFAPLLRS